MTFEGRRYERDRGPWSSQGPRLGANGASVTLLAVPYPRSLAGSWPALFGRSRSIVGSAVTRLPRAFDATVGSATVSSGLVSRATRTLVFCLATGSLICGLAVVTLISRLAVPGALAAIVRRLPGPEDPLRIRDAPNADVGDP